MSHATKSSIRNDYLSNLETIYAGRVDYSSGSLARKAATAAADAALAGQIKLDGRAWEMALLQGGLSKRSTRAQIAALPSE